MKVVCIEIHGLPANVEHRINNLQLLTDVAAIDGVEVKASDIIMEFTRSYVVVGFSHRAVRTVVVMDRVSQWEDEYESATEQIGNVLTEAVAKACEEGNCPALPIPPEFHLL